MSWPSGAAPSITSGSRFARAVYNAAVSPAGPEPTTITFSAMMSFRKIGEDCNAANCSNLPADSGARLLEQQQVARGAGKDPDLDVVRRAERHEVGLAAPEPDPVERDEVVGLRSPRRGDAALVGVLGRVCGRERAAGERCRLNVCFFGVRRAAS